MHMLSTVMYVQVGEFKEAFLAQQAQGLQAAGEVPALYLEVEQTQEAAEQQVRTAD